MEQAKPTIDNMPLDELKEVIRSVIKEEADQSHTPILGLRRRKRVKKWLWFGVAALIVGWLGYRTFFYESEYEVRMDNGNMYIVRTVGWKVEKREIKVVAGKWQLRYDFGNNQIWAPIYTPFEARYNGSYKFVFVGRGSLFWVSNDKTSIRPVRLMDGTWRFQSDTTDEWIDFESLYDDYYPPEP